MLIDKICIMRNNRTLSEKSYNSPNYIGKKAPDYNIGDTFSFTGKSEVSDLFPKLLDETKNLLLTVIQKGDIQYNSTAENTVRFVKGENLNEYFIEFYAVSSKEPEPKQIKIFGDYIHISKWDNKANHWVNANVREKDPLKRKTTEEELNVEIQKYLKRLLSTNKSINPTLSDDTKRIFDKVIEKLDAGKILFDSSTENAIDIVKGDIPGEYYINIYELLSKSNRDFRQICIFDGKNILVLNGDSPSSILIEEEYNSPKAVQQLNKEIQAYFNRVLPLIQ